MDDIKLDLDDIKLDLDDIKLDLDLKLDPKFVLNELLKIYNRNNQDKTGRYTGEIVANRMITIYFNDTSSETPKECFSLPFPSIDNFGLYKIKEGKVSNCTNNSNSGTTNMKNVMQFMMENNYDYYAGTDFSQLEFKFVDGTEEQVSLLAIKLFITGNSWYSTLGFITPNINKNIEKIEMFRNSDFITLINQLPIPLKIKKEEEKQFKGYINRFIHDEILTENDTENNKISYITNKINLYLKRVCNAKKICADSSLSTISSVNEFLNEYMEKLEVFCTGDTRNRDLLIYFTKMFVFGNERAKHILLRNLHGGKIKQKKTKKKKTKKKKTKKTKKV